MSADKPDLDQLAPLSEALCLSPVGENRVQTCAIASDFSNGPNAFPPEKGFPFGGLLASLAIKAMQEQHEIAVPIRTLSVQFLAAAKYGQDISFDSRLLRAGRNVSYASVIAQQDERIVLNANGTFGSDGDWATPTSELLAPPPSLDSMREGPGLYGPMAPRFTNYVDYRFETGPNILGGNIGKSGIERVWMRVRDGQPLDALRLAFLLDALYPPAMTLTQDWMKMTSVDLRYDFMRAITPDMAPNGWVFFEYRLLEHDYGWSLDDATVWAADGRPLAIARQRRKVL
jgi:acyl-CoA thioesterase